MGVLALQYFNSWPLITCTLQENNIFSTRRKLLASAENEYCIIIMIRYVRRFSNFRELRSYTVCTDHVNYAVLWCLFAEIMNVLQPGRVTTNPALPYISFPLPLFVSLSLTSSFSSLALFLCYNLLIYPITYQEERNKYFHVLFYLVLFYYFHA